MMPRPGMVRIVTDATAVVGVVVPGPAALRRFYSPTEPYLPRVAEMAGQIGPLWESSAVVVAVPLVDAAAFEMWCAGRGLDPADSSARARWGSDQVELRRGDDNGLPVFGGHHLLQGAGDYMAIAVALAAGWDGASPHLWSRPVPRSGWSRVDFTVAGTPQRALVALDMRQLPNVAAWLQLRRSAQSPHHTRSDHLVQPGVAPDAGWSSWCSDTLRLWWQPAPAGGQAGI